MRRSHLIRRVASVAMAASAISCEAKEAPCGLLATKAMLKVSILVPFDMKCERYGLVWRMADELHRNSGRHDISTDGQCIIYQALAPNYPAQLTYDSKELCSIFLQGFTADTCENSAPLELTVDSTCKIDDQ